MVNLLEKFISSRYDSKNYFNFINEFFEYTIDDNDFEDDDLNEYEKEHIQKYRFLGSINLKDNSEIGFFEFISKTPRYRK